jgi:hypothetical protein
MNEKSAGRRGNYLILQELPHKTLQITETPPKIESVQEVDGTGF